MAEEYPSPMNQTRSAWSTVSHGPAEQRKKECEYADQTQQHLSQAKGREYFLTELIAAQNQRLRELTRPISAERAHTQSRNDGYNPKSPRGRRRAKEPQGKVEDMEQSGAVTDSHVWPKARLSWQDGASRLQENLEDAEITSLRRELESLRKTHQEEKVASAEKSKEIEMLNLVAEDERQKRRKTERHLARLKKQRQSKNVRRRKEVEHSKAQFDELHGSMVDLENKLCQARLTIATKSDSLREKDAQILDLMHSIEALKDDNTRLRQQTEDQLATAHQLHQVRQKFATLQTKLASLKPKRGAMEAIDSIYHHLKQFAGDFNVCHSDHGEYRYSTDCGTRVCLDCLKHAVPEINEVGGVIAPFEVDCPWCRSGSWTWQALTIPYSTSWLPELEHFIDTIEKWTMIELPVE